MKTLIWVPAILFGLYLLWLQNNSKELIDLTQPEIVLKGQVEKALKPYKTHINFASKEHNVEINLIKAIVFTESSGKSSGYDYEKYANENSYGLGRILLSTARDMGFKGTAIDLLNPKINLYYTTKYIRFWLDKGNNNMSLAISSYNSGFKGFNYYQRNKRFWNPTYVNRVSKYYRLLEA